MVGHCACLPLICIHTQSKVTTQLCVRGWRGRRSNTRNEKEKGAQLWVTEVGGGKIERVMYSRERGKRGRAGKGGGRRREGEGVC